MKKIIHIVIIIILHSQMAVKAQNHICIDTTSLCYFNGITQEEQNIGVYQITNKSKDEYLSWVSLQPIGNRSNSELIHDFFIAKKGDFSFLQMMYEGILDDKYINIGYSFIKNIKKGQTFSYIIDKDNAIFDFYKERIVIIKRKDVESFLRAKIEDKYLFKQSYIYLKRNNRQSQT